jgi:serine/threonine-protein kinase
VKVLDFGLAMSLPHGTIAASESAVTIDPIPVEPRTAGNTVDHRLSLPAQILGTVAYMSPEQVQGQDIDQRSDLFAFGIVLYEMLTARHPWDRRSPVDTLHAILHDEPPPMHVASLMDAELAAITQKLLRKSPAERYSSADAVLGALGSHSSPKNLLRPYRFP